MQSLKMKKIYYNCEIVNQTSNNIEASYSASLLKPILDNPMQYNLNVNRFRLPMGGIPLTENNIQAFEKYEVGIGYTNNGVTNYATAFVPQYNQTTKQLQYVLSIDSGGNSLLNQIVLPNTVVETINLGNLGANPIMRTVLGTYIFIATLTTHDNRLQVDFLDYRFLKTITPADNIVSFDVNKERDQ